ncbi:hypothetical protein [Ferrovum sp. JA12]|uniref:hypothetical protein n=1 Tax=Ferrovum sp. JA12 TaxID=1356299 RepID=UPI000A68A6E4|nr:hypothetical protein [Ferrovum sp. JA12]
MNRRRWENLIDTGFYPTTNTLKANTNRLAFFACYRVVSTTPTTPVAWKSTVQAGR